MNMLNKMILGISVLSSGMAFGMMARLVVANQIAHSGRNHRPVRVVRMRPIMIPRPMVPVVRVARPKLRPVIIKRRSVKPVIRVARPVIMRAGLIRPVVRPYVFLPAH